MSTTSLCPSATREHGPGAKRVLPLLFLTCLLDAAGVGLIVPLLPTLIGSVAPLAVRDAATWGAALVMTFALLQLFFSPVLGSLSDRFGRRPVLVLAMLGFALSYLLLALADSLWMLFLGRALAGLTGASVATAMACAADLGTHGQRTRHFGWLYAGLALGMILGPALGGCWRCTARRCRCCWPPACACSTPCSPACSSRKPCPRRDAAAWTRGG